MQSMDARDVQYEDKELADAIRRLQAEFLTQRQTVLRPHMAGGLKGKLKRGNLLISNG